MEKRNEKTDLLLIMPIIILGSFIILCGFFAAPIVEMLLTTVTAIQAQSYGVATSNTVPHMTTALSVLFFSGICIGFFVKEWIKKKGKIRMYHTWDCGQPIDATMQYSATAFSAPIRFFFLAFIGRKKIMSSQPIVKSNPWIVKNAFVLSIRPTWSDRLYTPIAKILLFIADRMRIVQDGRIQHYVLFLLCALILTLLFAL